MRAWLLAGNVLGLAYGGAAAARAPQYSTTIVRTAYGIPHIRAKDWRSAGYGVGYAYAQDNLCMLSEELVTVSGERSQAFGAAKIAVLGFGEIDNLSSDLFFRSMIDLPLLRRGFRQQGPAAMQLVTGYVAGYNRWLRDVTPAGVPTACRGKPWVRPMTLDDMLRLTEKLMMANSVALATGIAAAAPPGAAKAATVDVPRFQDVGIGSNGWAFGGDVTVDGRGLLVGNPHFPWQGPNRFWQMHVTIPGKYDVMGAGLAGSPMPALGFNRDVAWTHTVTAAQHMTLFQLKLDPADPTAYLVDGKSEKMGRRTVSVPMGAGAAPVGRTLYTTRFGPVLAMPAMGLTWTAAQAFAVRDANLHNQRALGTWVAIGQSRSVGEVRKAVERELGLPWVNTIAADRNGDILHADVTAVPNVSRAEATECATPMSAMVASRAVLLDGSRAACDWQRSLRSPIAGLMPADEQAVYLRRDYLANSNDSYWLSHAGAPHAILAPILGPAGTEISLRTRSGLIEIGHQLSAGKIDAAAAMTMAFANHSLAAELTMEPLLQLCGNDASVAAACAALRGWDRKFDLDSRGAYLFSTFWMAAQATPGLWSVKFDPTDPVNTPRGPVTSGATAEKLIAALVAAAAQLDKAKIALDARWGDVQYAPRGSEHIPIHGGDGDLGVLNVQISEAVADGIVPRHGSSYVQVVGFDATGPVADAVLSYSQSTDPASPHFGDQTRLYSGKGWHRLPFTPAQIAADAAAAEVKLTE